MIKILRTLWAAFWLVFAILLTASITSVFMLFVAFPIGAPMAIFGSIYWHHVWVGFDKLVNAFLFGDHEETLSSRLGKSTIHGHSPVFGHIWIDSLVSWWLHQVDHNHVSKSIDWSVGVKS
jgi:hypothetical protein